MNCASEDLFAALDAAAALEFLKIVRRADEHDLAEVARALAAEAGDLLAGADAAADGGLLGLRVEGRPLGRLYALAGFEGKECHGHSPFS